MGLPGFGTALVAGDDGEVSVEKFGGNGGNGGGDAALELRLGPKSKLSGKTHSSRKRRWFLIGIQPRTIPIEQGKDKGFMNVANSF